MNVTSKDDKRKENIRGTWNSAKEITRISSKSGHTSGGT